MWISSTSGANLHHPHSFSEGHVNSLDPLPYTRGCGTRLREQAVMGSRTSVRQSNNWKGLCSVKFMSTHLTLCPFTRGCGTHLREQAVMGSRTSKRRVQQLKGLMCEATVELEIAFMCGKASTSDTLGYKQAVVLHCMHPQTATNLSCVCVFQMCCVLCLFIFLVLKL